jgi:hypothetical protein
LYLVVLVLFEDRLAAFFAALMLALTPEQLIWSATAAGEPSAAAASTVALLAAAWLVRSRTHASLVGTAVAAAYAVQFRPESLLIVVVIIVLVWQRAPEEFAAPRFWWAGLIFVALVAVHVGHLFAVRGEGWGTTGARFAAAYVPGNLRVNGPFYFADWRFPSLYTLLALVGLSGAGSRPGRLAIGLYFALFFGVTLLFYAGSYDYGADVRYSLPTYPPLMMLAGLGAARVARTLDRMRLRQPAAVLAAVIVVQFFFYVRLVRTIDDGAWASRADVRFAESLVPDLQGHTYVLTHNPGMFQVWGISAGQMSLAVTDQKFLENLFDRYTDGVYLHWNFWCNVQDPIQPRFCTAVLGRARAEIVRQAEENNQRYALYRLSLASSAH